MSRREARVIEQVLKDWRATAGGVLQAALVSLAVDLMVKKHGGRVSVSKVIRFLDEVSRTAERFKESIVVANVLDLANRSTEEQVEVKFPRFNRREEVVDEG